MYTIASSFQTLLHVHQHVSMRTSQDILDIHLQQNIEWLECLWTWQQGFSIRDQEPVAALQFSGAGFNDCRQLDSGVEGQDLQT